MPSVDTRFAVLKARMAALEVFTVGILTPLIHAHPARDQLVADLEKLAAEEATAASAKAFSDLAQRVLQQLRQAPSATQTERSQT